MRRLNWQAVAVWLALTGWLWLILWKVGQVIDAHR